LLANAFEIFGDRTHAELYGRRCACQFKIKQTRRLAGAQFVPLLFAGQTQIGRAKRPIMKSNLLRLVIIVAAASCSVFAQEKAALQPNATVVSLLAGSAGKNVELHLKSGEKMGGKIAQVTDNVVHLSNLTGAEYFDAFVDVKDISAVVVRVSK
jgi:hypothetical protein